MAEGRQSPPLTADEQVLYEAIKAGNQWREDDAESETQWIAPGLASGFITAVTGKPKEAGKTTFLLHACAAVITGSPFLGEQTTPGSVIYLSEESDATMAGAMKRAGVYQHEGFYFVRRPSTRGHDLASIVKAAGAAAVTQEARLVVIDTFAHFAGFGEGEEQDAGAVTSKIKCLQPLADAGLAVVVVVHDRKGGGSSVNAMRGSNALAAAVDCIVSIRPMKAGDNVRMLKVLGRGVRPEMEKRYVELSASGYAVVQGAGKDGVEASSGSRKRGRQKRQKVLTAPLEPLTFKELESRYRMTGVDRRHYM